MRLVLLALFITLVLAKDYKVYNNMDCPNNDIYQEKTHDVASLHHPNT